MSADFRGEILGFVNFRMISPITSLVYTLIEEINIAFTYDPSGLNWNHLAMENFIDYFSIIGKVDCQRDFTLTSHIITIHVTE